MGNVCISKDETFDFEAELKKQTKAQSVSVEDANDEMKDCGPARRNILSKDALVEHYPADDAKGDLDTVWKAFEYGVQINGDGKFLGTRPTVDGKKGAYIWKSYSEVAAEAKEVGAGLASIGVEKGDAVGICSANRHEWTASYLGMYSQSAVCVALYDTLGENALEYIINHAQCKVAIVSKAKLHQVVNILDKVPTLKTIVQFDEYEGFGNSSDNIDDEDRKKAEEADVRLLGYTELRALGKEAGTEPNPPAKDDLMMIMYTSGTTGTPKGVKLTHGNLASAVGGALTSVVDLKTSDVHISFLPLAHIFETIIQVALIIRGAAIGFFGGNVKLLVDDIGALKPTIFAGVPRVFVRIYDKIMSGLANAMIIKKIVVMNKVIANAKKVRRGQPKNEADDAKIFSKIREKIGLENCRLIITGAAPCPPYLMEFLKIIVTDNVVQGYGMTETSAVLSGTALGDHTLGHVGPPATCVEIRLQDVPDMGYKASGGAEVEEGEILVRGPGIFTGYYKNDEATAGTIEPSGWMHTGDIGRWNPNGTLSIIDRKKNMFKLAQGEYVASEKIEGVYARSMYVGQIFVYGNSYKSFLIGVVSPDPEKVSNWLKEKGWWGSNKDEYLSEGFRAHFKTTLDAHVDDFKKVLQEDLKFHAKNKKLHSFEQVRDVIVETEIDELGAGFNVANDCLTPTFKLRRPFLLKRYNDALREAYTANGEAPKPDEKW